MTKQLRIPQNMGEASGKEYAAAGNNQKTQTWATLLAKQYDNAAERFEKLGIPKIATIAAGEAGKYAGYVAQEFLNHGVSGKIGMGGIDAIGLAKSVYDFTKNVTKYDRKEATDYIITIENIEALLKMATESTLLPEAVNDIVQIYLDKEKGTSEKIDPLFNVVAGFGEIGVISAQMGAGIKEVWENGSKNPQALRDIFGPLIPGYIKEITAQNISDIEVTPVTKKIKKTEFYLEEKFGFVFAAKEFNNYFAMQTGNFVKTLPAISGALNIGNNAMISSSFSVEDGGLKNFWGNASSGKNFFDITVNDFDMKYIVPTGFASQTALIVNGNNSYAKFAASVNSSRSVSGLVSLARLTQNSTFTLGLTAKNDGSYLTTATAATETRSGTLSASVWTSNTTYFGIGISVPLLYGDSISVGLERNKITSIPSVNIVYKRR